MTKDEAMEIALSKGWLAEQPASFSRLLLEASVFLRIERRTRIFLQDDPAGGLYGLVAGALGISICGEATQPRLVTIIRPVFWFGQAAVVTRGPRIVGVYTNETSQLLHVPLANLDQITWNDPEALRAVAALGIQQVGLGVRAAADLLIRSTNRRIAATLLRCLGADADADDPVAMRVRATQDEIAEMSNVSRDSVNRCLSDLNDRGWITTGYNHIDVRNRAALFDFAYGEDR